MQEHKHFRGTAARLVAASDADVRSAGHSAISLRPQRNRCPNFCKMQAGAAPCRRRLTARPRQARLDIPATAESGPVSRGRGERQSVCGMRDCSGHSPDRAGVTACRRITCNSIVMMQSLTGYSASRTAAGHRRTATMPGCRWTPVSTMGSPAPTLPTRSAGRTQSPCSAPSPHCAAAQHPAPGRRAAAGCSG
jgi:hypothetical protein